jgi:divalent metal cation (Fe/Co/Zn/Cd) transporter
VRGAVDGMMDGALVGDRLAGIVSALDAFAQRDVAYKNLKTRRAGTVSFIQVDILVPRQWTVGQGHDVLDEIEFRLREIVPGANIVTHLEPKE